ncbi:MAG: alkaline phosphatase [Bacteroidales bacterium]
MKHFRYGALILLSLIMISLFNSATLAQENTGSPDTIPGQAYYKAGSTYPVEPFPQEFRSQVPKNVILLIGDGMGVSQVTGALVANGGQLYMSRMPYTGFTTTWSASDFITDSGAGGTALATGKKTYNSAIGVGPDSLPVMNIREIFASHGKMTGVISTSSVTHATPAAFVAHQPDREMHEAIALDFVNSGIDLFIGGGLQDFIGRADSLDLIQMLEEAGYYVDTSTTAPCPKFYFFHPEESGKVAALYATEHLMPVLNGRGDYLVRATSLAIQHLSRGSEGFFLMVEGSQIDWGGHDNLTGYVISETLDFDQAVGEALKFAAKDGRTLVIVTSDHETGGFSIPGGCIRTGTVQGAFNSDDHTAALVPVFAYGPGADLFMGIFDNTGIFDRILRATKTSAPAR